MCYELYLSTSSDEDLTRFNSERISFERLAEEDNTYAGILANPHRWFVPAPIGCSCGFRHLPDNELGFAEPQDWYPEDQHDIEATAELYRVIHVLSVSGHQVDCLDAWYGTAPEAIQSMKVGLRVVSEKTFRLFENYHFIFEGGDGSSSRRVSEGR